MIGDALFALRWLRKTPAFSLAAIGTIALGIGVNTAVFSVVHGLLLKPLPYPAPDQLVMVWQDMTQRGGPANEWATPGNFVDWRGQDATFAAVASIRGFAPALTGLGEARVLAGEQVSQAYFDVLGVQPAAGRAFRFEETVPNAPRVVIISHRFWQERFGGGDVLGKGLTLAGESHEIIGVMPPEFRPAIVTDADVWRPDRLNLVNPNRGAIVLRVVARLKPGVTVSGARASLATLAAGLSRRYPASNANVGFRVVPLHEQVVGNVRPGVLVLMGAVVLVLLIACVNIANLLLARAAGRSREMAVRVALGAGRARVVRQLLTEAVVLAGLGGGAGVLLGFWGLKALVAMAPAGTPRIAEVSIDPAVLLAAAALTAATGVLFGLAPALQSARTNHTTALKEGGRGSSGASGQRLRRVLIVAEIAIALMLLVGGGLLVRSFVAMQRADLGFDPSRLLVGSLAIPPNRFPTPADASAFHDRLLERAAQVPGVTRVATTTVLPLTGDSDMDFEIEGGAPPPAGGQGPVTWYRAVSPDYLSVMGMTIRRGRSFNGREAEPVVLISETLASRYWPGADPIGRRVRFGGGRFPWFTIVGITADIKQTGARGAPRGQMFIPYWQAAPLLADGTTLVLKTSVPPESVARALTEVVRELDGTIAISGVQPMVNLVAQSVEEPRFLALITGVFAALALLLAAVGVYGVMAYAVAGRRQELGVRLALGASRADVFGLVFADGLKLSGIGLALGAAGAVVLAPALSTMLYGVKPLDGLTFGATAVLLLLVAMMAVFIPARRATRVDPSVALRGEC